MAYGTIKILAANSHTQVLVGAGNTQYPSIRVLNPNDGVLYVAENRDCLDTNYGSWDWKIPSQSFAVLPGRYMSAGLYFLDQSGAGRPGEVTVYQSLNAVQEPFFGSIGRALAAQINTMDITEGTLPANPPAGVLRAWADASDVLHALNNAGTDESFISTRTVLGGMLSGFLPNPGLISGIKRVAQTTLGASVASVTLTGWGAIDVLHGMILHSVTRCDSAITGDWIYAQFDGDTGNNYDTIRYRITSPGGTPTWQNNGFTGGGSLCVGQETGANSPANQFAASWFFVPFAGKNGPNTGSQFAGVGISSCVYDGTTNGFGFALHGGQWHNTGSQITTVKITSGFGNFVANSMFAVYGLF